MAAFMVLVQKSQTRTGSNPEMNLRLLVISVIAELGDKPVCVFMVWNDIKFYEEIVERYKFDFQIRDCYSLVRNWC